MANHSVTTNAVCLHLYGSPVNHFLRHLGIGFCLSSVEVYGTEHIFRPHDDRGRANGTGIVSGSPLHPLFCLQGEDRFDSIVIGDTQLDHVQVLELILEWQKVYTSASYHSSNNNCHHFADRLCRELTGNPIPLWINRAAKFGFFCKCLIEEDDEIDVYIKHRAANLESDDDQDYDEDHVQDQDHDVGDDHGNRGRSASSGWLEGVFTI